MPSTIKSGTWFIGAVFIVESLVLPCTAIADDTWATDVPMSYARHGHALGVIDQFLYVVGGSDPNNQSLGLLEELDTATGARAFKTSMSFVRTGLAVGVIDDVLYAVGGYNGLYGYTLGTVEAYDRVTNSWSTRANMPTARYDFGVGIVDDRLYAVGGNNSGLITPALQAYDPSTDTWQNKAPMPTSRHSLGIGVVNGILYAVGGENAGGLLATLEAYDPATDTWTSKAPMPTARKSFAVGVVGDILYAVGGYNGLVLNTVEAYDPATDTWTTQASMPTARYKLAAGVVSPLLYAVGGNSSLCCYDILTKVEAYTAPVAPPNLPPTAVSGPDRAVHVGQTLLLNGGDSFDDNTEAAQLQYLWTLVSQPAGSATVLSDAATPQPTITADALGIYVVELVVTDEEGLSSAPARVTLSSENLAPTAVADVPQAAPAGQMVTLSGTGSVDPDGDALGYAWQFVEIPAESAAVLAGSTTASASFVPDVPGEYVVGLVVSDGYSVSTQSLVTVSVATPEDELQQRIADALSYVRAMPANQFKAPGHQNALMELLKQAIVALEAGNTALAAQKVNAVLARVDGNPLRGRIDQHGPGMDWVTNTAAQTVIHQLLSDAMDVQPRSCQRHGAKPQHHDDKHGKHHDSRSHRHGNRVHQRKHADR